MINRILFITSVSLIAIFLSCEKPAAVNQKPVIAVSIPPQKYFVEKIAGNLFDVIVMIPPGASPHTYEPKPSQMVALSKAKLFFSIGVEFEKAWIERIFRTCPGMIHVPIDTGIQKIPMDEGIVEMHSGAKASHGNDESLDPHIWLSPELVKKQAMTITETLCRIDPSHAELFKRNDSLFVNELSLVQDTIRRCLSNRKTTAPFLVFHPSWGYFAREFGLRQVSIEVQGKEPTPGELAAIMDLARKDGIKTIYAQPQFSRRTVTIMAREIGAKVVIADPIAANWKGNILQCARAMEAQ